MGNITQSLSLRKNEDKHRNEEGQGHTKLPWYQCGKYCKLPVCTKCFGSTEEELNILRKSKESFTKTVEI